MRLHCEGLTHKVAQASLWRHVSSYARFNTFETLNTSKSWGCVRSKISRVDAQHINAAGNRILMGCCSQVPSLNFRNQLKVVGT